MITMSKPLNNRIVIGLRLSEKVDIAFIAYILLNLATVAPIREYLN